MSIAFFISMILNFMDSSDISYAIFSWQRADWIPGSGGLQALSFAGIITSLCLIKYKEDVKDFIWIFVICRAIVIIIRSLPQKVFYHQ